LHVNTITEKKNKLIAQKTKDLSLERERERERERETDQRRFWWRQRCRYYETAFQSCSRRWLLRQKAFQDQIYTSPTNHSRFPAKKHKADQKNPNPIKEHTREGSRVGDHELV